MANQLNDSPTNCPSAQKLNQFLSRKLNVQLEAELDTHISQCAQCQTSLERMTDSEQGRYWRKLLDSEVNLPSLDSPLRSEAKNSANGKSLDAQLLAAMRDQGFALIKEIGRGGVGVVYLARQTSLDRNVAIKMLLDSQARPDDLARFVREANSMAEINHHNVIQIHQVGECLGQPFQVQEFIDGPSLSQFSKHAPLDPIESARCMFSITKGIVAAHRRGVLHRDLKPSNILLVPVDKKPEQESTLSNFIPKVADFGLARPLAQEPESNPLTRTNQLLGTPQYMSPEQVAGNQGAIDHRSDIYSLGVILYKLLTGRLPFSDRGQYQLLKKIESVDPPPPRKVRPEIPKDLESICMMCLEKNRADRYATTALLSTDLDRFLHGQPIQARQNSVLQKAAKWISKNRRHVPLVAALTIAGVLLTLVMFSWLNRRSDDFRDYRTSLAQARQLLQSAEAADLTNIEVWNKVSEEAERAAELERNYPNWAPEQPGETLSIEARQNQRDRSFFRQLESKWENEFLIVDRMPTTELAKQFGEMLGTVDLSVDKPPTSAANELKLKNTRVRNQFKTAMFYFADSLPNTKERKWCLETLDAMGDEEWRLSLLQTLDVERFRRLLESPEFTIGEDGLALVAATAYKRTGDAKILIEFINTCIEEYPESFWLSMFLAKNHLLQGNLPLSTTLVQNVVAKHDNKAVRFFLSKIFHDQTRYAKEEFHLSKALEFDPEFKHAITGLARCLHRQKRYEEAIPYYLDSLEMKPLPPRVADQLLQCYVDASMPETARQFAEELIHDPRNNYAVCQARAKAFLHMGRRELAIEQFVKAIEHAPLRLPCYHDLAKIYVSRKDYASAEKYLRTYCDLMPMSFDAGGLLIEVLDEQGKHQAAMEVAKVRVAHLGRLRSVWEDLGKTQVKLKDDAAAESSFRKSLSIDPESVTALVELGKIHHRGKRLELAESSFRDALRVSPSSEVANAAMIDFLLKLRRNRESVEYSKALAELRPRSVFAQWKYMEVLRAAGEIQRAIAVFEVGREIDGPNSRTFTDTKLETLKSYRTVIQEFDSLGSYEIEELTSLQASQFANIVLAPRGKFKLAAEMGVHSLKDRGAYDGGLYFSAVFEVAVHSLLASQMQEISEKEQLRLREQAIQLLELFVEEFESFTKDQPKLAAKNIEAWRLLRDNDGLIGLRDEKALLNVPKLHANRCRELWQQYDQIIEQLER